ncbi:MAG: ABC transporter permease subunit [candidate division Zixibacteria bacterium]|nr:ABC transporter permease subunit [candidate division Zixibacteria bacterium]MDH3937672.1 ABC transporter permease subunit [candidate division Zixibacteria bacterium]MDH4033124.1 ABC transporter permease subunit [candidate division Zixibacteria bacterium]
MQTANVVTIFKKEIIDTLRDRRTLMFMLLVPLVAIPLLMMGMSKLMISQISKVEQESSRIVIMGRDQLPADLESILSSDGALELMDPSTWSDTSLTEALTMGSFDALLLVPDSFGIALTRESKTRIEIKYDQAEIRSEKAEDRLTRLLEEYQEKLVLSRLAQREINAEILKPFEIELDDVAPMQKLVGERLGAMLPYLIIIMCFMGAMYPAIDLAAGEKERGTLETLLVSPATRGEFVVGKYLVIVCTGVIAALMSLGSLMFSMTYMVDQLVAQLGTMLSLEMEPKTVLLVLLVILPLVGIFAGMLLSLSIFARSFKEAQSYVTVLNLLIIMPAFVSILPGFDLNYTLSMIPVVNVSMIMKEAISGTIMWNYVIVALVSNSVLAALSLVFCKKWFERESVIFRM